MARIDVAVTAELGRARAFAGELVGIVQSLPETADRIGAAVVDCCEGGAGRPGLHRCDVLDAAGALGVACAPTRAGRRLLRHMRRAALELERAERAIDRRGARGGWGLRRRAADFRIGPADDPYMERWHILPRNPLLNVYLHRVRHDDDDRALHDHPWVNASIILRGELHEVLPGGLLRVLRPGRIVWRRAAELHRLKVVRGPVWTLFLTGPIVRVWGFACAQGWVHWRAFTAPGAPGEAGKGCE